MRRLLLTTLILATAGCSGGGDRHRPDFRHGPPPGGFRVESGPPPGGFGGGRGHLFVSPMGEPFRSNEGGAPQDRWFAAADTDHDGALTMAEFEADAARWFAVLDRGHDGEIDPEDIDYYENTLLPELRTGGPGGGGMGRPGGGGGGGRGGHHGGGGGGHRGGGGGIGGPPGGGGEGGPDGASGGSRPAGNYSMRQGAARFGYLDYPEPVTAADRNFNRGVDAEEFRLAADERFALLDANHDGKITQSELPHLAGGGRGGPDGPPGGRRPVPPEGDNRQPPGE